MKNLNISLFLVFSLIAVFGVAVQANIPEANSSFELTCRAKAKEVAADIYRNCVTENRNAEILKLKKDYQERLRSLKDEYEKEFDKLGVKKSAKKPEDSAKLVAIAKVNKTLISSDADSMTVESRPAAKDLLPDESRMDLPEPIPVEKMERK